MATVPGMEDGPVRFHHVQHGSGRVVLVLHGGGVDHREAEACFEPALDRPGLRRVYPDLPGSGRTPAPPHLGGADDVVDALLAYADALAGPARYLLVGHSAGAYLARGMASRRAGRVAGLALVCPLLPGVRDVPEHRVAVAAPEPIGDEDFRDYFVVHSAAMLDRYERYVVPGAALQDAGAAARIGARWRLAEGDPYPGPTLVVAGRLDSTVGYAAAVDLLDAHPHASVAVVDGAGHALPHERPDVLRAALAEWLARVEAAH